MRALVGADGCPVRRRRPWPEARAGEAATGRPTSSSSWPTTSASPTSAATAARSRRRTSTRWRRAGSGSRSSTTPRRCWPTRAALLTGYYAQQVRRDTVPGMPERQPGHAAGVGAAAARAAPAARLSLLPLGQVARRRQAAGGRLRPLLLARGPRPLLQPARTTSRTTGKLPPVEPGTRLLRDDGHRRPRDQVPEGARGGARRRAVLPLPRVHRAALPAAGAARGHRPVSRAATSRAGTRSARERWERIQDLGIVAGHALGRRARGRPAVRLPRGARKRSGPAR